MPEFSATIFWFAATCFLVAEVAIIRAAIVGRLMPPPGAGAMPEVRRGSEITWALLPALGLAVLMGFTWRAIQPADDTRTGAASHGESGHTEQRP